MEMFLINSSGSVNITETISSITLSGEYRSCCRTISFGIIKSATDSNTHIVGINLGDNIKLVEDGKIMFYGIVWDKGKSTDGKEININCKDYGIYLLKNRFSYKFKNIAPESIARKVCSDFGIKAGTIAAVGKTITRNFLGGTLCDIIMTAYTLANDKKYMIVFEGEKINVIEKGQIECKHIETGINLLTSNVSETLNGMINKVNVFNKDDKLIKTFENSSDIKKYGKMSEYIKAQDSKEDYTIKAKRTLNSIEQKIAVTNFGDVSYQTGRSVIVTEPYTGLKGRFFIDVDEHNWKNGIYTNKLTLNFKNLMDEKESGSNG